MFPNIHQQATVDNREESEFSIVFLDPSPDLSKPTVRLSGSSDELTLKRAPSGEGIDH